MPTQACQFIYDGIIYHTITRQIATFLKSDCKNSTLLVLPTLSMPTQKVLCFLVWFPNQSLHITVRQKTHRRKELSIPTLILDHMYMQKVPYFITSDQTMVSQLCSLHHPSSATPYSQLFISYPRGTVSLELGKDKHWQWRCIFSIAQQTLQFWAAPESGLCLWHWQCKPRPHIPTHSSEQQLPAHTASSVTCGDQEGEMSPQLSFSFHLES